MKDFKENRISERIAYFDSVKFTILFTEEENLQRIDTEGKIINISNTGIGVLINYPLEQGHVLEWDDKNQKGKLHLAAVRWCKKVDAHFRAGLMLL